MNSFLRAEFEKYALMIVEGKNLRRNLERAIDQAFKDPFRADLPKPVEKPEVENVDDQVEGKESRNKVTSPYGMRIHPVTKKRRFHNGIDIQAPEGTEILAWDSGKVTAVNKNSISGNYVVIEHSDGFESQYAHLSKVGVKVGQSVNKGQPIGLSGRTGVTTGAHLHFILKKDKNTIDPTDYIKNTRLTGSRRAV